MEEGREVAEEKGVEFPQFLGFQLDFAHLQEVGVGARGDVVYHLCLHNGSIRQCERDDQRIMGPGTPPTWDKRHGDGGYERNGSGGEGREDPETFSFLGTMEGEGSADFSPTQLKRTCGRPRNANKILPAILGCEGC